MRAGQRSRNNTQMAALTDRFEAATEVLQSIALHMFRLISS